MFMVFIYFFSVVFNVMIVLYSIQERREEVAETAAAKKRAKKTIFINHFDFTQLSIIGLLLTFFFVNK